MSVWNGHYACTCYHRLFVFNQFGDLERSVLSPGNVHSADGWDGTLKPVVVRYQGKFSRIYFRADAAFAMPEVYEYLETERIKYAIRLPANQVLQSRIGYLLKRPVGRPPNEVRRLYANFTYQAGSWVKPRRVIAKVEWHSGELYALSARRLHRHQSVASGRAGRRLLQQARHMRAMDQRGQGRHQVDAAVTRSRSHGEVDSDRRSGRVRLRPPTLETTMQTVADRSEAPNAIRTDLGAIFVSLELHLHDCLDRKVCAT